MNATQPTMKSCWTGYLANLGRAAVDGEAAEFAHAFDGVDPVLLRRALDAYFGANPEFSKIPGLRATYSRVVEAVEAERKATAPRPITAGANLNPEEIRAAIRAGGWNPEARRKP